MDKIKQKITDSNIARWSVVCILGFVLAGNYYFYDAFSPLKIILERDFGFSSTDFGLYVSFYSIPNTFLLMAILGGVILDKFGIRRTGFLFVLLMSIGALITAYGTCDYYRNGGLGYGIMNSFLKSYSPELKMMLLGRFFFGLGAETSIVVISKTIVKWFKGKELALAFGIKLGFARVGSVLAFNLSPILTNKGSVIGPAIWFGAIFVCIGILAFLCYIIFDKRYDKQLKQGPALIKKDEFHFSNLLKLLQNRPFIYITLLCLTFYSAVFPFLSFSSDFFLNKFGVSLEKSGQISSLLPLGTVLFTPLFGLLVDKKGKGATLMIFGSLLLLLIHLTFAFTTLTPYVPMVLLGIAFSLVPAAMWPSVAKIVDEKRIGTAYGIMFSIQNLGLWGFPILAGVILDRSNPVNAASLDYTNTMIMFSFLGIIGLIFAFLLKKSDKKYGTGLELPSKTK